MCAVGGGKGKDRHAVRTGTKPGSPRNCAVNSTVLKKEKNGPPPPSNTGSLHLAQSRQGSGQIR